MVDNKNKKFPKVKRLVYNDIKDDDFPFFKNDKERIKYMKKAYGNMSIAKSFAIFYGEEVSNETKQNRSINQIQHIEVGQIYTGTVKDFDGMHLTFTVPGVKEEIVCKDNFNSCTDEINNYLLSHDNKLMFEVREKKNDKYYVSVINAYYKAWLNIINDAIKKENGIRVHIDTLVRGGYMGHTQISTLYELTGKNYTHSVFIPGSHIVLNIEHDFEKWIDQNVIIVPQKFVEYSKDYKSGITENSLVGSRKRVLQIYGMNNLADMYTKYLLSQKDNVTYTPEKCAGVVTGVINSNNKTGVFVELTEKHITGLLPVDGIDLPDYKPGDELTVIIKEFECQDGKDPFVYNKKGQLVKCNVRAVFERV